MLGIRPDTNITHITVLMNSFLYSGQSVLLNFILLRHRRGIVRWFIND